jgi:putative exosortase-associated protein (TIGR04073 family)
MKSLAKTMVAGAILTGLLFIQPQAAQAAGTPFQKFSRGLTNMVTAPFEFFRQPFVLVREYDYNPPTAFFAGIFTGIYATVARELVGVYEFLTFPCPWPGEYRSLIDPPTVFQGYQTPRDYKK